MVDGAVASHLYLLRLVYIALCYVALRTLATKQYFRSFFRYIRRCTIVSIVPNNNDYDDDDDDDDDDAFRCDNCLIIVDARV